MLCGVWRMLISIVVAVAYVLGSGPILGFAFWLREITGWDGFYAAAEQIGGDWTFERVVRRVGRWPEHLADASQLS